VDIMVRLIAAALVTGLVVSGPVFAQKKDCGELKSEIEAKIKKNGVDKFSLDVVEADKSSEGKVVGTCEGGSKKIVYKRG
jgi:outer membrane lipoprotein-sorting protein